MGLDKKILLVDDEEGYLSLIKDALEVRGFEVATATSAIEAGLELAGKKPDMILMDIRMPGINGMQACSAIKKNSATVNIPIIAVSAVSDDHSIKEAYKAGVSDYFIKPIDIEKLVKRIREILKV
ncbi:MAG: response regulator transcription factor [Candidatus Omnitrophota bacterium]|nr:response regulator transcription factor [Candidatus Omnitrophota bacterium]